MTFSLSNSLPNISSCMQTVGNQITDRLKPRNLVKVGLVVAPIFTAMQMVSSVPTADGGLALFHICMAACLAAGTGTGGAFWPMCVAICCPTAPAPTP